MRKQWPISAQNLAVLLQHQQLAADIDRLGVLALSAENNGETPQRLGIVAVVTEG